LVRLSIGPPLRLARFRPLARDTEGGRYRRGCLAFPALHLSLPLGEPEERDGRRPTLGWMGNANSSSRAICLPRQKHEDERGERFSATHVVSPGDVVVGRVGSHGALEVDVVALLDVLRNQAGAEAEHGVGDVWRRTTCEMEGQQVRSFERRDIVVFAVCVCARPSARCALWLSFGEPKIVGHDRREPRPPPPSFFREVSHFHGLGGRKSGRFLSSCPWDYANGCHAVRVGKGLRRIAQFNYSKGPSLPHPPSSPCSPPLIRRLHSHPEAMRNVQ